MLLAPGSSSHQSPSLGEAGGQPTCCCAQPRLSVQAGLLWDRKAGSVRCPSWRLKPQDAMQALAEAEAELVAGSRSEPADLSLRRDSAADMHIREAPSGGHNPAGSCPALLPASCLQGPAVRYGTQSPTVCL